MSLHALFQREIDGLLTLEAGQCGVYSRMVPRVRHRRVAQTLLSLLEDAERHIEGLYSIRMALDWPEAQAHSPALELWQSDVERDFMATPAGELRDAVALSLLRRGAHLKIPCYANARLLAFHLDLPLTARTLRQALEDEQRADAQMDRLAELSFGFGVAA